jgi:hypothetical protein
MGTSQFGLSERDAALFKKFQGNGWTLTCSEELQKELSAVLGDACMQPVGTNAPINLKPRIIGYEEDWADTVLRRSMSWKPSNGNAPLWLEKATEGADCAMLQMPSPDNRWIVKFAGRILEPFNYRMAGWSDLREIMTHGFMLDRTALIEGHSSLAQLRMQGVNLLAAAEFIRTSSQDNSGNQEGEGLWCTFSGTKLHGLETQHRGKMESDRWTTCADDFDKQLRNRLDRVLDAIGKRDGAAAAALRRAIHCKNGRWSFSDSYKWMTTLRELQYDARMTLKGGSWEIEYPDSAEILTVPDSVGLRAIARVLTCHNIACPCALVTDDPLLSEFLGRPQHHKYFEAIHRRPKVICEDAGNGEVEQSLCRAMGLRRGWHYFADHLITERSELHTVCGLPTGKVTLKRADALEGIRDLIRRQRVKRFFCASPGNHFESILSDIEGGIAFARKHESLLNQVQPRSEDCREKVRKAIYRLNEQLSDLGDWTTRYDRLATHLSDYITGGVVLQYTGPYRWRIEGLPHVPDSLDLAADHVAFKRRKILRARARIARRSDLAKQFSRVITA